MTGPIAEAAPAKINLHLHVVGKREDGYHLLDSTVVFCGVHDTVCAAPSDSLSLTIIGPTAAGLAAEPDNLVLRAARLLWSACGSSSPMPGAAMTLIKRLPVASGIGGGSADAAAALRALVRLWQLQPAEKTLLDVAAQLGADVPVCLRGQAAHMSGIGEQLAPLPDLPPCGLLLVNPGVGISTPHVFRARQGPFSVADPIGPEELAPSIAESLAEACGLRRNDLEPPARTLTPAIQDTLSVIEILDGVLLTRMSGSGATCFGLFRNSFAAQDAARTIRSLRPTWWVASGPLLAECSELVPNLDPE